MALFVVVDSCFIRRNFSKSWMLQPIETVLCLKKESLNFASTAQSFEARDRIF
jgi:hypothetical protein